MGMDTNKKKLTKEDLKDLFRNVKHTYVNGISHPIYAISYMGTDYYLDIDDNYYIKEELKRRQNIRALDAAIEDMYND